MQTIQRYCQLFVAHGLLLCALALAGCGSQPPKQSAVILPDKKSLVANDIVFNALGLVGTPYRWGGNSPDGGFDCSGLIQYVYQNSADLPLPRTVAKMSRMPAPSVAGDQLLAGDLVIFATESGRRPSHAGIYVGEGRFVHAPRTGGTVRMDFLGESYWRRSYLDAKRPLAANWR